MTAWRCRWLVFLVRGGPLSARLWWFGGRLVWRRLVGLLLEGSPPGWWPPRVVLFSLVFSRARAARRSSLTLAGSWCPAVPPPPPLPLVGLVGWLAWSGFVGLRVRPSSFGSLCKFLSPPLCLYPRGVRYTRQQAGNFLAVGAPLCPDSCSGD
jgi:hypothetical protein